MSTAPKVDRSEAAADVRRLVNGATTAVLGTLDRQSGHPYASLVTVAAGADHVPVMLLSGLAMHSRNIAANARASLLLCADFGAPEPLTLARVTLLGTLTPTADPAARATFLARHPSAAAYADFGDFGFYLLAAERAHFIGGFGRIVELSARDLSGS